MKMPLQAPAIARGPNTHAAIQGDDGVGQSNIWDVLGAVVDVIRPGTSDSIRDVISAIGGLLE